MAVKLLYLTQIMKMKREVAQIFTLSALPRLNSA